MKAKYSIIVIPGLVLCLFACKKVANIINPSSIVGKWYENKLSIKQQNIHTGNFTDTTYLSNNFSTQDYFQFNSDSTAVISNDGTIFNINGKSNDANGTGTPTGEQLYFRS